MYQDTLAGGIAAGHRWVWAAPPALPSELRRVATTERYRRCQAGDGGTGQDGRNIDHRAAWLLLSWTLFGSVFLHFPSFPVFFSSVAAYLVLLA